MAFRLKGNRVSIEGTKPPPATKRNRHTYQRSIGLNVDKAFSDRLKPGLRR